MNISRRKSIIFGILPGSLSRKVDDMLAAFNIKPDITGVVKTAMLLSLLATNNQPFKVAADQPENNAITLTTTSAAGPGCDAVIGSSLMIRRIEHNTLGNWFRRVIANIFAANSWLIELNAAEQTRPLNANDLTGYFALKGIKFVRGSELTDLISVVAAAMPKIMTNSALRSQLMPYSDWLIDHNTVSLSPLLVKRCIEATSAAFPDLFTINTIDLVEIALRDFWDYSAALRIPRKAVVVTYAYLEACKMLPVEWNEAEKIVEGEQTFVISTYLAIFRKFLEIKRNNGAIAAAMPSGFGNI
jgi:hypothetical protein